MPDDYGMGVEEKGGPPRDEAMRRWNPPRSWTGLSSNSRHPGLRLPSKGLQTQALDYSGEVCRKAVESRGLRIIAEKSALLRVPGTTRPGGADDRKLNPEGWADAQSGFACNRQEELGGAGRVDRLPPGRF